MIEYIDHKLNQWGLWCRSGRNHLGFPARAAFMRLVPNKGGAQVEICDEEAMQINRAVQCLDSGGRLVVELFYVRMRNSGADQIAKELHCCRDTLYARLHRAHVAVMEAVQDEWLLTSSDTFCKK